MEKVYTIGFTKTSAEHFFNRLKEANVTKVVDVRLNNTSQLSGFAKSLDLSYFLKNIIGVSYSHTSLLAPTQPILDKLKKLGGDWHSYERDFMSLMEFRRVEEKVRPEDLNGACLLCSEEKPHHCHRRLVCDYLNGRWGSRLLVTHL